MMDLWERVLGVFAGGSPPPVLNVLEDNQATLHVCARGRSTNLRHVSRTHRVNLDFLYDISLHSPHIYLQYVRTTSQAADIFTKGKFTTLQWKKLITLCGINPLTAVQTKATVTNRADNSNNKSKKKAECEKNEKTN